jgi:predicted N-acyltransferase
VRRERRRFADSGIEMREERVVDAAARLAPLLAQTERRYGRATDPGQIAFHYTLLGMHLGGDFLATVAYRRDRPVACSLLLRSGNRLISKAWGCDYAAAGGHFLYFNLTFYEPIVRAIERRIEVLDLGLGSLSAKEQRGCAVERLQTVLVASDC